MSTNKLKHLLAENMRRFNTKNLYEVEYQSPGNLVDRKDLNIIINSIEYDTNISGIHYLTFQGTNTSNKNDFQDIITDIKHDIEKENDPTGAYDQTRLVSDIKFDCELKVGANTIDFTVTFDEDGAIQNVEIQDDTLARKHGINDQTIVDYLF